MLVSGVALRFLTRGRVYPTHGTACPLTCRDGAAKDDNFPQVGRPESRRAGGEAGIGLTGGVRCSSGLRCVRGDRGGGGGGQAHAVARSPPALCFKRPRGVSPPTGTEERKKMAMSELKCQHKWGGTNAQ